MSRLFRFGQRCLLVVDGFGGVLLPMKDALHWISEHLEEPDADREARSVRDEVRDAGPCRLSDYTASQIVTADLDDWAEGVRQGGLAT